MHDFLNGVILLHSVCVITQNKLARLQTDSPATFNQVFTNVSASSRNTMFPCQHLHIFNFPPTSRHAKSCRTGTTVGCLYKHTDFTRTSRTFKIPHRSKLNASYNLRSYLGRFSRNPQLVDGTGCSNFG